MPLSYSNSVPQANQIVANTQAPILTNFQSVDSAFNGPTGSASGGGNFTTYNVQSTTTSYVAKPVNPTSSLHTIASTSGNPELAYINNVNATGAGPYNGVQITGGGITAVAWCYFVDGNPPGNVQAYNCTPTFNSAGNYTITFTRQLKAGLPYVAIVNGMMNSPGDTVARSIVIVSQDPALFRFQARSTSSATSGYDNYHCVFFGYQT